MVRTPLRIQSRCKRLRRRVYPLRLAERPLGSLHAGILRQASDIHIDPEPDGVLIRFRLDGVLDIYKKLPSSMHSGLTSRFKGDGDPQLIIVVSKLLTGFDAPSKGSIEPSRIPNGE
jgi:hypothetical protein